MEKAFCKLAIRLSFSSNPQLIAKTVFLSTLRVEFLQSVKTPHFSLPNMYCYA